MCMRAGMAAAPVVKARCIYETCFVIQDPSPAAPLEHSDLSMADPLEKAVYPILKKIGGRPSAFCGSNSSLRTAYSAELNASETNEVPSSPSPPPDLRLNRSCSLQHHLVSSSNRRGFSLHLSPKRRVASSRMCSNEAVLSPISDKSETNGETCNAIISHHLTVPAGSNSKTPIAPSSASRPRPALSLFKPTGGLIGAAGGFNSSDSGISISAASSHEALLLPSSTSIKPAHLSLNSSHEFLEEESLPFLMPKLHRSTAVVGGGSGGGLSIQLPPAFHHEPQQKLQQPVRQLSLPFSFTAPGRDSLIRSGIQEGGGCWVDRELTDDTLPIESRSYYHGSITRRDAEMRLKPEPAGTFLVRDSLASRHDYFLAARGENGFLHVLIYCRWNDHQPDNGSPSNKDAVSFSLATLPDRSFPSVSAVINHCANIGLYSPRGQFPPLVLKYPLHEDLF